MWWIICRLSQLDKKQKKQKLYDGDKFCHYAATVGLNQDKAGKHFERISKIKSFKIKIIRKE